MKLATDYPFKPGYYCPECDQPIDRPKVWHNNCQPPKWDPRRRIRTCPGCGKKHSIQYRRGIRGNTSQFCNNQCKQKYANYMNEHAQRCRWCNGRHFVHLCDRVCGEYVCVSRDCTHWGQKCYPTFTQITYARNQEHNLRKKGLPYKVEADSWAFTIEQMEARIAIYNDVHAEQVAQAEGRKPRKRTTAKANPQNPQAGREGTQGPPTRVRRSRANNPRKQKETDN